MRPAGQEFSMISHCFGAMFVRNRRIQAPYPDIAWGWKVAWKKEPRSFSKFKVRERELNVLVPDCDIPAGLLVSFAHSSSSNEKTFA